MNIYQAMGIVLAVSPLPENPTEDEENAFDLCRSVVDAYDALAPKAEQWAAYPWAQWYAVDKIGAAFFATEPYADEEECCWFFLNDGNQPEPIEIDVVILPDHIDWRDCKWQRPEVTK